MKVWEYLSGPSGPGFLEGRCFVAMPFSLEHEAIYNEGIRPAVNSGVVPPLNRRWHV